MAACCDQRSHSSARALLSSIQIGSVGIRDIINSNCLQASARRKSMRKRATVDEFQLATKRHTMSNTRNSHTQVFSALADIKRSRFALNGWIGSQNYFCNWLIL